MCGMIMGVGGEQDLGANRTSAKAHDLALPSHLQSILDAEYPRFSPAEMARRRAAVESLIAEFGLDHLVFCGANRFGSVVQWLTGWPVTAEAVGVLTPGEPDALFVQYINHVPMARRLAEPAEVTWGGGSSIAGAIGVLERRVGRPDRVGVIGPMTFEPHAMLTARVGTAAKLNQPHIGPRAIQ